MDPTKSNDTKFALGAIFGGAANVVGHGAPAVAAKVLTVKVAGTAAMKAGATLAMFNPVLGTAMLIGGVGYLMYKSRNG